MAIDSFEVMTAMRKLMIKRCRAVDAAILTRIPVGFTGNLVWHLGHTAVTTGLLTNGRCGVAHPMPAATVNAFKKGTTPADMDRAYSLDELEVMLLGSVEQLRKDSLTLGAYPVYETSTGVVLNSLADACAFLSVHDGIHVGYVLALARAAANG